MTKARAACIRNVIASELKQEYEARAYRDAFSFDWYDYAWRLDPDDLTALWNNVQDWTAQSVFGKHRISPLTLLYKELRYYRWIGCKRIRLVIQPT